MALGVILAIVVGAACLRIGIRLGRRLAFARELRGDWWPRFEEEFRRYAHSGLQAARDAERRG